MKEKFNNFFDFVSNQGIEVSDKTNPYQCMDLAYAWVFYLNYPKATIQNLYAYQAFTNPKDVTRKYFDLISYTPGMIIEAGWLAVFDKTPNNIAGHIAVTSGKYDSKSFESFDQNWAGQSKSILVTHNYDNPKVLGFLKPKVSFESGSDVYVAKLRQLVWDILVGMKENTSDNEVDAWVKRFENPKAMIEEIKKNDDNFKMLIAQPYIDACRKESETEKEALKSANNTEITKINTKWQSLVDSANTKYNELDQKYKDLLLGKVKTISFKDFFSIKLFGR